MADASSMSLAYEEETDFGVTPEVTADEIRFSSESLKQETSTTESQEIRSDRQIPDVVRTGINAAGDINGEFSYGAYDYFFEKGFLSDDPWSTPVTDIAADTGISVPTSADHFLGIDGSFTNYSAGEWVLVAGFTEAANNGLFKIESIDSTSPGTVDDDQLHVYATLVLEAAGDTVSITEGSTIKNGTLLKWMTIEKTFTDLSSKFERCLGMAINGITQNVTSDGIITMVFSFIGKSVESAATAVHTPVTAAAANDVMNAIDHVSAIFEGNAEYDVTTFSWTLTNNLRSRLQVATLGAISLGKGTIGLSGTIQAYFEDETVIDKYLNFTASSLALNYNDSGGNKYVVEFPRVKYTDGARVAGGQNQDIIADMAFTAYRHPTEDCTMRMVRFPAA